jgi:hypothetical protein
MSDHSITDRVVDVASVALISVAAVLTAVCGYQAGRWGEEQSRLYSVASANHIRSAEAADRAIALTAIDVNLFLRYVDAVEAGDTQKARMIDRWFRPEMRPAMNAWLVAQHANKAGAPSSPFVMPQYRLRTSAESHRADALADASFQGAQSAARHADEFLLLTVIFATVSFLAGMSTKMVYPRHAIVVGIGILALIYGFVRLAALPFM